MSDHPPPPVAPPAPDERVSQGTMHLAALAALTLVAGFLCYKVFAPLLPALAWALALAVIAYPVHAWIQRRIPHKTTAAIITTTLVVFLILVPSLYVAAELVREAGTAGRLLREQAETGKWREAVAKLPYGEEATAWVEENFNIADTVKQGVQVLTRDAAGLLTGSVWAMLQMLVCVFTLYYCFRDGDRLLRGIGGIVPLPRDETARMMQRVDDSIMATVYGTIVTGLLQGVTGGLLFWAFGLPAPVLWGVAMFILGVLPILGGVIVWLPAAALLVSQDKYWQAIALVVWGILMAGPVCNFVYARLAGDRMRLHPVPALVAYIGGLAVFGITGMVVGPIIVVLTFELIAAWRRRAVPQDPTDPEGKRP